MQKSLTITEGETERENGSNSISTWTESIANEKNEKWNSWKQNMM